MAETSYEDLSRIDRMTVTAFEERSTEGVPLSIILGSIVGLGAGAGVVGAERLVGLENTHTTIPTAHHPPKVEPAHSLSGIEAGTGLATVAFVVAAIHMAVRHRYKRIVSS